MEAEQPLIASVKGIGDSKAALDASAIVPFLNQDSKVTFVQ
jgi:hypothetical protein